MVITHLSPDQGSELAQVLQHFTAMPVQEAADGLPVRPDQAYVIPPNRDKSLLHGSLLLFAPTQPSGRRLPACWSTCATRRTGPGTTSWLVLAVE